MATLKEQLSETIKTAMKAGEKELLQYARTLHAAIRKKEVDERIDLDDVGVVKIVATLVKQRNESIDQFRKGNRDDLVAKEEAELKFLMQYQPAQMSETEIRSFVESSITESGAKSAKDMGLVMKVLMPKLQGRADGKLVNQIVREKLV